MISAELPLFMRILLVLNPSIFNIMTRWSLWLSHSPGIGFVEGHILVHLPLFERGYHVNAIHLSLACFFEGPE